MVPPGWVGEGFAGAPAADAPTRSLRPGRRGVVVLDVGCGTGALSLELVSGSLVSVVAVDLFPSFLVTLPRTVARHWAESYPGMRIVDENLASAREMGWEVVGHFPLPARSWSEGDHGPLRERLPAFREAHGDDPLVHQRCRRNADSVYRCWRDDDGHADGEEEVFVRRRGAFAKDRKW